MIIKCLACGAFLTGNEDEYGQVYVVCPSCHKIDLHLSMPDEVFGDIMMQYKIFGLNNKYVILSMMVKDSKPMFFVLSNAEVIHEGYDLREATDAYVLQGRKLDKEVEVSEQRGSE